MATTQQNVIKRFMHSLDLNAITSGKDALSQAIAYASGGYLTDITTAINKMLKELNTYGATKFLSDRCGINLSNSDTGAITGSDAGGSKAKTAASIVPESGKLNTSFNANSFTTKDGLTIRLYSTPKTDDEKYMWRAIKTWWAEAGLTLIKNSYGYSFADSDATVKDLTIQFKKDKSSKYLAATSYPQYINGHYTRLLTINTAQYKNFASGDVNGQSSIAKGYLDRTLAHELTHVVMMSKVDSCRTLPQFILEGLAELTHGIDDLRTDVIKSLANSPTKLKNSLSLSTGSGVANAYAGGYIFLRWFAKQAASNYSSVSHSLTLDTGKLIFGDANANSLVGGTGKDSIFGAAGNDTLYGNGGKDILWGDDGNDIIYGGTGNDTLNGGAGADSLSGGTGNDFLTGGAGDDVFAYTAGNDIITDYATGDKIYLDVANISKTTLSGSNVIFTVGTGKISVQGAKGERITLLDTSGKEYSTIVGGTTLIVNDLSKSPVTVSSDVKIIDGSERTKAVKITGNSLANKISGGTSKDTIYGGSGNDSIVGNAGSDKLYGDAGKDTIGGGSGNDSISGGAGNDKLWGNAGNDSISGGDGNDTIWGGAGNDSLWGDAGADKFIYASGNDIIFGFANNDTLTLDGLDFTSSYKNGAVTLTFDDGSVTLKDFTAKTFHIDNSTYKISGSKLVKK
ncbi:MAG: calcium-binding protein [Selenomonadaceae bacterium]|nr:calcium-binding protein [Selenomonadaceae bacterium]